MAQVQTPQLIPAPEPEFAATPSFGERLDVAVGFLRRRYLSILLGVVLALPFAAFYLFATPASYTASSAMMIATRDGQLAQALFGDPVPDAAWIESQIGVLKSQSVAAYVVKQLRLADDPEFTRTHSRMFDRILAKLGLEDAGPKSEEERAGAATAALMNQLDVRRVGSSYLMQISFRSNDREQAVKIANAMIDAYIFDQLNAKYQSTRRASDWLLERLQALREQAATAERAVVEYKAKNNIVKAGGGLMNEQQLSEMSSQLATVRVRVSDLQARIARIDSVRSAFQKEMPAAEEVDESVSDALNSSIITRLRNQYLDLVNRERDWSVRYGQNHIAVVNLRKQINDIRASMRDELGRISETYKSDYEISKKRQVELEGGLNNLISQSQQTNQAQVVLFSLEFAAQSYRKLYDNFLQRQTESVQQQSYPISNARAVSSASAFKSGPKTLQVWMLAIFGGAALGLGFGVLQEKLDRGFRTAEQVREALGVECLAQVPLLADQSRNVVGMFRGQQAARASKLRQRAALQLESAANNPNIFAAQADASKQAALINMQPASKMMWAVLDEPASPYTEAIRSIKLTLDMLPDEESGSRIIGLTSSLPGEGKSTISRALATLLAQSGARVILVDGDLRNPTMSRALAPMTKFGWPDVIDGKVSLADAVWNDPNSKMKFLPIASKPSRRYPADIFTSNIASSLFTTLRIKYDYVIVDLAPLVANVEVRASSSLIDSHILVIEWGSTKVDAVKYAMRNMPALQNNLIGAVLNKVDMNKLGHYDNYGAQYYYGSSGLRA